MRRYKKKNRRSERAKQNGHIVNGKRISMWDDGDPGDKVNSYYHAKYKYEVNGKEFFIKKKYYSDSGPNVQTLSKVPVYYKPSNPKKAYV